MNEKAPVPVTDQWSEGRGFTRLYHNNPHFQSRLAMALCGLRAEKIMHSAGNEDDPTVQIIDLAIKEFTESHGEFLAPQPEDPDVNLGDYEPNPELVSHINGIVSKYD